MPPPQRYVSVFSDDGSDENLQVSTPPTTSESSRGEEVKGASKYRKSNMLRNDASFAILTAVQKILAHVPAMQHPDSKPK